MDASELRAHLLRGHVIPAHPLALDAERRLDEISQRALTRYYLAAGAGGIAVGVHTTQFEIRRHGLLRPVLTLAAETAREAANGRPAALIAGAIGETDQAVEEAALARALGYDAVLLSLGALGDVGDDDLLTHCAAVAEVLPLFGFYLQPAVGGRHLSENFWRRLAQLERLVAIKIAPFDRYRTLDVVRAIGESGRSDIALYTGNDDSILVDLLTPWDVDTPDGPAAMRIRGGLLGHWAVWTRPAVEYHHAAVNAPETRTTAEWLALAASVTVMNAAIFDPAHGFRGCIPGIAEVLHRQRLISTTTTLDRNAGLSPGQAEAISRVIAAHPSLVDDAFIAEHRDEWRS